MMSTPAETVSEVKTDLLYASISLKKEENERNQKEDIALHPFFLQILFISSTSVHFSAKKEVSSKKGNSCT